MKKEDLKTLGDDDLLDLYYSVLQAEEDGGTNDPNLISLLSNYDEITGFITATMDILRECAERWSKTV